MATVTANANTFSVFPPPRVPRISVPNPHNRKPSLKSVVSPASLKESVVIALEEIPVPKVPEQHTAAFQARSPIAEHAPQTPTRLFKNGIPGPPPLPSQYASPNPTSKSRAASKHTSTEPGSVSSSETLVRLTTEEERSKSPAVPMRSMFPVWNPNVPLQQQSYFPQRPTAAYAPSRAADNVSHAEARSVLAPSVRGTVSSRPLATYSVVDVPLDVLNANDVQYSSPRELEKLWEATHGTEPNVAVTAFDLEMGRTADATFSFGSSPDLPFYTVTTYDTSEISVTKTCPRKRNLECDVALSSIESPSRRLPPNDGLVSFIFPKMAAMLAINQSNALAEEHGLAPTHRDEIQAAAMKRAAGQEASYLRYNPITERYELEHPAVSRAQRDPNFALSPVSPQGEKKPVLHITISKPNQHMLSQDKPTINVTYIETSRSPIASIRSGLRSRTSPETGVTVQLASLDFNSNTLHIEVNNILELMPSLFAIDSIVSAMVIVAIADRDTNVVMGGMEIWTPKPSRSNRLSWTGSQRSYGTAAGGMFYATIAEREEAESEARVAAKVHKKDMKNRTKSRNFTNLSAEDIEEEPGRSWYGKSKEKKSKKKQIVIGEFDLEKLGHYQSGSRQGQELPAVTRGALGLLVSSLKFFVWFLTMIVQFLAWIMVSLTRGVTSEKF